MESSWRRVHWLSKMEKPSSCTVIENDLPNRYLKMAPESSRSSCWDTEERRSVGKLFYREMRFLSNFPYPLCQARRPCISLSQEVEVPKSTGTRKGRISPDTWQWALISLPVPPQYADPIQEISWEWNWRILGKKVCHGWHFEDFKVKQDKTQFITPPHTLTTLFWCSKTDNKCNMKLNMNIK